jgi:hypothetical protein
MKSKRKINLKNLQKKIIKRTRIKLDRKKKLKEDEIVKKKSKKFSQIKKTIKKWGSNLKG